MERLVVHEWNLKGRLCVAALWRVTLELVGFAILGIGTTVERAYTSRGRLTLRDSTPTPKSHSHRVCNAGSKSSR